MASYLAKSAPLMSDTATVRGAAMLAADGGRPAAGAVFQLERWLELMRVRQWVHLLPLPIAGYEFDKSVAANILPVTRGIGIAFCILAFGYLLNAVADRNMDLDRGKNPLSAVQTAAQAFHLPLALLVSLALGLAATASLTSSSIKRAFGK